MNFNLMEELDIKGHLTISKVFPNGTEELVFDDHNIIVSGMGVALMHLFSLSGSGSILDFQIDRFQVGVSGSIGTETSAINTLVGPLSSVNSYNIAGGQVLTTSGHIIKNNAVVTTNDLAYALIRPQNITRIDDTTVRYTLVIDKDSCNGIQRDGVDVGLNEVGLFVKNIKAADPTAPILVAYRTFSNIVKTSYFALVFRWSINF